MRLLFRLTTWAVLAGCGAPAWAERVEVDGVTLDLPLPEGFCARPVMPGDARNADIARRQPPATAPIIMAELCGTPMPQPEPRLTYGRWLLLLDKGKPRRLAPRSTRANALRQAAEGKPVLTTGMVFQMGFLSPNGASGLIGGDGIANYRALVLTVSAPMGGSLTQAGIEGETVLRGRSVAFQLFDTYRDDGSYIPLEAEVKKVIAGTARLDPTGDAPRGEAEPVRQQPSYSPRLEFVEMVWLLVKAVLIAAVIFAASAWWFRRNRRGRRMNP